MPPDRWLEVTVASGEDPTLVSSALLDLGADSVQESGDILVTYFLPPSDPEAFLELLRRNLAELSPSLSFELSWRWQAQEDWEILWRRGLGVRRISPRLLVVPSWETLEPGPGEIPIYLDPGMAFGTAEHATTRGCLRQLDKRVVAGARIADVGAGSGILSIAAAKLGAESVMALELDPMSCETALENLAKNGVEDRVAVRAARVEGGAVLPGAPFHGIVANLQSHLLLPLFSTFRASLSPGGWLIVSGVLDGQQDEIFPQASLEGFVFVEEDQEGEWWTGAFESDSRED
jgi:ribosomal protein L11 methyltransferase